MGHYGQVGMDPPNLDAGEEVSERKMVVEMGEEAQERQRTLEVGTEAKKVLEMGAEDLSSKNLLKLFDIVDANIELEIRNEFLLNGEKVEVAVNSTSISFVRKKFSLGFYSLKQTVIPFEDIVTVKTSRSQQYTQRQLQAANPQDKKKFSFCGLFRRRVAEKEEPVNVNKFGFLGSMADTMNIYYVPDSKHSNKFTLEKVSLRHEDPEIISHWSTLVGGSIPTKNRPLRLLVFINPHGGKGQAPTLFYSTILPLFTLAGIDSKIVLTERANHARDLLQTLPLAHLDGVISVGGDGMFAEVFNGVLLRTARDAGLDPDKAEFIRPSIRVGFIPGGSTDCVSLCLHGNNDPITAALHIILGDRIQSDAVSVRSDGRLERVCMTMVSYGYFGDLIRLSERLRWLGPKRYDIAGVKTFMTSRSYSGTITYKGELDPRAEGRVCGRHCKKCKPLEEEEEQRPGDQEQEAEGEGQGAGLHTRQEEGEETGGQYKQIRGKFQAISAVTMVCKSPHTKEGMSPEAHFGDGNTDLIIVHKTSRLNYLRYLVRVATHWAHPFSLPFVQAIRVKEFSFKPEEGARSSVWNCDGEIVNEASINVKVHRQLVPVFARGIYSKECGEKSGVDANYNNCYEQVCNEE